VWTAAYALAVMTATAQQSYDRSCISAMQSAVFQHWPPQNVNTHQLTRFPQTASSLALTNTSASSDSLYNVLTYLCSSGHYNNAFNVTTDLGH